MIKKLNCWEFKKCGREFGGVKAGELGICVATTETKTNGINSGENAGRACWAVAGTLCSGIVQGTFAMKLGNCLKCDFYKAVIVEESSNYQSTRDILKKLEE